MQVERSAASSEIQQRVLLIVFLTVFLDLIGFGLILPLLPLYVQSMGGSAQTVGLLLTSFSFTQLLTTPLLGRLSDRYGRRKIILFSLFGNAVAMVVFALATQLELLTLLFISRIVAGATAGNIAACQAAIADVTSKEERAKGMGRLGAGVGLGMVLGPVAGSALSHLGGWAPPLAAAGMALLDLVLAFFLMPETLGMAKGAAGNPARGGATARQIGGSEGDPATGTDTGVGEGAPLPSLWTTLLERRTASVMAMFFLAFLGLANLQVSLALMAQERLHWGETEVGYLFGLFGLVILVVQGGLLGRLAGAFGELNLVLTGVLASAVGFLLIGFAFDPVRLVAGLLLFAIGTAITNPSLMSLASRFAPHDQQGAVLGFAQSAGGLARAIGPAWAGFLFARYGAASPFFWSVGVSTLTLLVGLNLKSLIFR